MNTMNIVKYVSKTISILFSPLLAPAYGMLIALNFSEMYPLPVAVKFRAVAVVALLTGVIPLMIIYGLSMLSLVKDASLFDRKDRTVPYAAAICLYVAAAIYIFMAGAPRWMILFMLGGIAGLLIVALVNRRWKISAHAAGMGGLVALGAVLAMRWPMIYGMETMLTVVIMAAGLTCTARLIMRCHTPLQVCAGFAAGFLPVALLMLF